jgi:8-oxo-dGTP diphosphatase
MLSFTLCIIQDEDRLAMIYREKRPNIHKWNFVGGKIESGESIKAAAKREAEEETKLTIGNLQFRGIVKWNNLDGMYVYFTNSFQGMLQSSNEGKVEWKEIDWILNSDDVVSNIPKFLPHILDLSTLPKEHHFHYNAETGAIIKYEQSSLTERTEINLIHS